MAAIVDWASVEARARKMTDAELDYAIEDCMECVRAMGDAEMIGKDAAYYRDEASVYARVLTRRCDGSTA